MDRICSKEPPIPRRRRGMIAVPVNIQAEPAPTGMDEYPQSPEATGGYSYTRVELPDNGQDLQDTQIILDLRQTAEHQAINQAYTDSLADGCLIESLAIRVDCKPENCADFSQSLAILGMAYADQPNATVTIRDYYNINHPVTFAEFQVLCQELGAHVTRLRQEKWAAVDALANLEA